MKHIQHQRGAAILEFAVVGPMITLIGMALLQYAMLFFAKGQINHASFIAARAGSVAHADLSEIRSAYTQALIPLYGGGRDARELATAFAKASTDVGAHTQIELLNPTKESFEDWNDADLQKSIGKGKRVIPNRSLAFKDLVTIKPTSHQNLADANLIKVKITHGYAPKIPLIGPLYIKYLQLADSGGSAFSSTQISQGRIPVVTQVTLHMQSDAIEPSSPISSPGTGTPGQPKNPGVPDQPGEPAPDCSERGCVNQLSESRHLPDSGSTGSCDASLDPGSCLPPGCKAGDASCDARCSTTLCCGS